jgi:hypothetical protein
MLVAYFCQTPLVKGGVYFNNKKGTGKKTRRLRKEEHKFVQFTHTHTYENHGATDVLVIVIFIVVANITVLNYTMSS